MLILSHPLNRETPTYADQNKPIFSSLKCMSKGDSCNHTHLSFSLHTGTHIDAPLHFSQNGKSVTALDSAFWFFSQPAILMMDPAAAAGSLLEPQMLHSFSTQNDATVDLLLIKTGFGNYRGQSIYWENAPAFIPDFAAAMRQRFPKVRCFGFDLISLTSLTHRDLGRRAHHAFLDHDQPIVLIEDMDLSQLSATTKLHNVLVSPLMISGSDGSPCTVWANIGL